MRSFLFFAVAASAVVAFAARSTAAVKEISYPAVSVEVAEAYKPDAAFEQMQKAFVDAVARRDAQALFALVGPTFVWTTRNEINEQLDYGRDALHNFKVVFGFRQFGKEDDEPAIDGPFWDTLLEFAADKTFYRAGANLVCGPTAASIVDESVFERAKQRINADDSVEWYFILAEAVATATPAGGAQVGRVGQVALPVLNVNPPRAEGKSGPPVTHLQVLLPSGRSGWIQLSAARPLSTDILCYAPTPSGAWKIAAFDQAD